MDGSDGDGPKPNAGFGLHYFVGEGDQDRVKPTVSRDPH
jgi:hypothetical protein